MRHLQFNDSPTNGQSYIYLEDTLHMVENPRLLIGKIKVHGIARKGVQTPDCVSGFPCSDNFSNPFERGHIMSWDLGGPNVPENIVPMYAAWQGKASVLHQSWRNMESEIKNLGQLHPNQNILVVVVEYGNNGNTYPAQKSDFSQWNQYFDWNDYRIPTGFRVYVEPVGTAFGIQLCTEFLTRGGLGPNYVAVCNGLLANAYAGNPAYTKIWNHSTLPPQDREFLLMAATKDAIPKAWGAHCAHRQAQVAQGEQQLIAAGVSHTDAKEYASAPFSPAHNEAFSFINEHPEQIHELLEDQYFVSHADALTLTPGIMVPTFYGNAGVLQQKRWNNARDEKLDDRRVLVMRLGGNTRVQPYMRNPPK